MLAQITMMLSLSTLCVVAYAQDAQPPPVKPGKYVIRSAMPRPSNSICIDIPSGDVDEKEAQVQKMPCNKSVFQQWTIEVDKQSPNRYVIHAPSLGNKYLDIAKDNANSGNEVLFRELRDSGYQRWRIHGPAAGPHQIINDGSGKCLDFKTGNQRGNVQQHDCQGLPAQHWYLERVTN